MSSTLATIQTIASRINTKPLAVELTGGTETFAVDTAFAAKTLVSAGTAIVVVRTEVDTGIGAFVRYTRRAGQLTLASDTDFTAFAGCSTLTAVSAIGQDIETATVAIGQTGVTDAFSGGAVFVTSALNTAATAVVGIDFWVDTSAFADGGCCRGTGGNTLTGGADLTGLAGHRALTTIGAVGLDINADAGAIGLSEHTGQCAFALNTTKAIFADIATLATMSAVCSSHDAGAAAIGLTTRTGHGAFS